LTLSPLISAQTVAKRGKPPTQGIGQVCTDWPTGQDPTHCPEFLCGTLPCVCRS